MSAAQDDFVSEEEALRRLRRHTGLVIVDLDETLYLQNTTEDFVGTAVPGYAARAVMALLHLILRLSRMGDRGMRDVWRVRLVMVLFPWTLRRWRRLCLEQGMALANRPLLAALLARPAPVIVASSGFSAIIHPWLDAVGCAHIPLIACDLRRTSDRLRGKLGLITAAIGPAALADALVITDSREDRAVLRHCASPCLTVWAAARCRRAFRQNYLPGDYLAYVKRPGLRAARLRLLGEDLTLWLLAALSLHPPGLLGLVGIACLFLSFWAVYEIGYWENDLCAQRFEADPVLSEAFRHFDTRHFAAKTWVASGLFGLAGLLALSPAQPLVSGAVWLAVLLGLRGAYFIYNRADKTTRVWLYLLLQVFRSFAVAAIVPIGGIAAMACLAQAAARWQSYAVYRYLRRLGILAWPEMWPHVTQLAIFLAALAAIALAAEGRVPISGSSLLFCLWMLALARGELREILGAARRIDSRRAIRCGEETAPHSR